MEPAPPCPAVQPGETTSWAEFEHEDKRPVLDAPYSPPPDLSDIPFEFKLLVLPALVFLGKFAPSIIERWRAVIQFPYQLDAEEGFILHQALRIYTGHSIYAPITAEPYLVGNYPPLAPWIISLFVRPQAVGLEMARLVIIEFAALTVMLIALTVGLRTRRAVCAGLAAVLFAATYEFHQWSAFCRVDFPALALTLAGLCVFLNGRSSYATAASALLFVAAGYARQTALLAPLACMAGLALHDRRRLPWFLIPYLGCGSAVFIALNTATGGEFFRHTITYNRNVLDWGSWRMVMQNEIGYFQMRWIVAIIVGASFCAIARIEREARHEQNGPGWFRELPHTRGVVGIYATLATLSLVSFAKVGSAPNYALEPLAAWAVFGTETLGRLFDIGGGAACARRRWARAGAMVTGGFILLHGLYLGTGDILRKHDVGRDLVSSRAPNDIDRQVGMSLLAAAQAARGPVLSELPIFTILAGREVLFQPFIISQLAEEGKWDERLFAEMLDKHRFALIITTQDLRRQGEEHIWRFTPGMVKEILRRYELHASIGGPETGRLGQTHFLWRPILNLKPKPGAMGEELKKISSGGVRRSFRASVESA